jgi:hypothetical protein
MEETLKEVNKKYVLWTYADYGWHPKGFDTLKEALEEERHTYQWFITNGKIDYKVEELVIS